MKNLTPLKIIFLSFLLIFLSCLINPDNPVDPEYKGDYNILLKNSNQPADSVLEILYPYSVTIKNLGLDRFWMIFLSGSSADGTSKLDSFCSFDTILESAFNGADSARFNFYFTKPFTGVLYLTGLKPNRDSVKIPLFSSGGSVKVINPYSISGKTIAGLEESVVLSLRYKNNTIPSNSFFDSVYWKNESSNIARVKKMNDTFHFKTPSSPDVQSEFLSSLFYGSTSVNMGTVSLPVFRITTISGSSPVISAFNVRSNHTLTLGEKAQFSVKINDQDTNFLRLVVLAKGSKRNDTLLSTKYFNVSTDTFYIETDSILKDTNYESITLFAYDQDSLYNSSTLQMSESAGIIHKEVSLGIDGRVFEPQVGIRSVITVNGDADKFFWIYHDSVTVTDSNSFALPAYSSTATDTISVFAKKFYIFSNDTSFTFTSDTLRILITPTSYNYRIHTLSGFPDTIKVKNTYVLNAGVFGVDNVQIPDSSITYKWKFSDTSVVVTDSSKSSSRTILCKDSTANFIRVTIKASFKNSGATIQDSVKSIYIRSYRPFFRFVPLTNATLSSINNTFSYIAHDSSNSGLVSKILFRQIYPTQGKPDSISNGSPLSMKFSGAGDFIIIGQARDTENMVSKADTLKFTIKISIPQFKDTLITDTVSVGKKNTISVDTMVVGQVSKYIWNFGNYNSLAQCTTTVDSISVPFMKEGICTTTVQCYNSDGMSSVKPFKLILHVLKIPPVVKITLTQSDSIRYIQKPLSFTLSATDNDADLDSVYFVARYAGIADSFIVKVKTALGSKATYKPQFTPANSGIYTFYMTATDKSGNRKTDSLNLTIDKGMPVADSLSISEATVYIKDECSFTIHGHDNDTSLISYSMAFDDSVNGFEPFKQTSAFSHTFGTAGTHYIYSRLKDALGQISPIRKDSVSVHQGKPVISGATISYISPETDFFVNDSIFVTVNFHDTNGTVDAVYLDDISDANPPKKGIPVPVGSQTYTFGYRIPVTASGTINFNIWCTDNDSVPSDTNRQVLQVRKAAPVFTGISTNNCWVVDSTSFIFTCADSNGSVKKIDISWGDGTFSSEQANSITNQTFKKAYPNLSTRSYNVIVSLTDDDGLLTVDTENVTVNQGLPGVRPLFGSGDTIFAPVTDNSNQSATLKVSANDTNGHIVKYYWQLQNSTIDSTTTPFKDIGIIPALVNTFASYVYVSVKDDDGNIVSDTFLIFIDGMPTAPDTVSPHYGESVSRQAVKLVWKNSDSVDGNKTEFAILYSTAGGSPSDTLSAFKAGSVYAGEGADIYSYTFDASQLSGIFSWQIIARDRVGNISKSPISQFFLN